MGALTELKYSGAEHMADLNRRQSAGPGCSTGARLYRAWAVFLAFLLLCTVHSIPAIAANGSGQGVTGAEVYLKYCAGCHGFDGVAAYPFAPSFALGERLHKSDAELLRSVLAGRHAMPYWQSKLSVDAFRQAIAYLRTMDQRYRAGLPPRTRPIPERHYKFNPVGEGEHYWENRYW